MAANSDISIQPSLSTNHLTWQHDTVNLKVCHPRCVESEIQCIKLCVYSHIHTVKTQQISQIVSLRDI
jgi:hypothetical protein